MVTYLSRHTDARTIVRCDTQPDLLEAIADLDVFQGAWHWSTLADTGRRVSVFAPVAAPGRPERGRYVAKRRVTLGPVGVQCMRIASCHLGLQAAASVMGA